MQQPAAGGLCPPQAAVPTPLLPGPPSVALTALRDRLQPPSCLSKRLNKQPGPAPSQQGVPPPPTAARALSWCLSGGPIVVVGGCTGLCPRWAWEGQGHRRQGFPDKGAVRRSLDTGSTHPGEEVSGGPWLVWRSHRRPTRQFPGLERCPPRTLGAAAEGAGGPL